MWVQYFNHLVVPKAGHLLDLLTSPCSIQSFLLCTIVITYIFCYFNANGAAS